MKKVIIFLFCCIGLHVRAQNLVRDRLNSKKVDTRIILNFDGENLSPSYSIDNENTNTKDKGAFRSFNNRTTFSVTDQTSNIQLRFLNPFQYRVKLTNKEINDPLAMAVDTLISSVRELAILITPKADFKSFFTSSKNKTISESIAKKVNLSSDEKKDVPLIAEKLQESLNNNKNYTLKQHIEYVCDGNVCKKISKKDKIETITLEIAQKEIIDANLRQLSSSMLFEWGLWFDEKEYCYKKIEERVNLLEKIINNEKELYNETFEKEIKDDFQKILKADNVKDYKKNLEDVLKRLDLLLKDDKLSNDYKNLVSGLNSEKYYNDSLPTYNHYSIAKLGSYINYSKKIYARRISILKGFKELCEQSKLFIRDAHEENNTILLGDELKTVDKMINQITISVQKVEWEEYRGTISWKFKVKSSNEISKATFNVVPYASVVTEFGVGILYFFDQMEFPEYAIVKDKDGKDKVAITNIKTIRYLPAPTVTFIPRWGKGDIFPQFQIGVSLANSMPVFHFGAGLRLFSINNAFVSSISLMGGVAYTFVKTPNVLAIGDEATAEKLSNDLQTKIKGPAYPYFGLQFNF